MDTSFRIRISTAVALQLLYGTATAQPLLTQAGFTGTGLVPTAYTIPLGLSQVHYSAAIPGAANPVGHSMVAGWGLGERFELSGRLITQSVHCNFFFQPERCPAYAIRDLSSSVKWSPRIDWIEKKGLRLAIGAVDVGGAANLTRADYAVVSADRPNWRATAGVARGEGSYAPLRGVFADITFKPVSDTQLGLQTMNQQIWAHAAFATRVPGTEQTVVTAGVIRRVANAATPTAPLHVATPKQWWNTTLSVPLSNSKTNRSASSLEATTRRLPELTLSEISAELERQGFKRHSVVQRQNNTLEVQVENTSYKWNIVDAAGVAAAVVAAADRRKGSRMHVRVQALGFDQLHLTGETSCIRGWIERAEPCADLKVISGLTTPSIEKDETAARDEELQVPHSWNWPRPEFVMTPVVQSLVGTEFGALDYDLGYTVNMLLPLWRGATIDISRIHPTGRRSDDFETGYYRNDRFYAVENRRMFHQLVAASHWNTQLRLSVGRAYETWEGRQVELQTQTTSGQDRATLVWGKFENPTYWRSNRREYFYLNWRHAWDPQHNQTTNLVVGEFWSGDKGAQITHRFWFGETNVAMFLRESSYGAGMPRAWFGGLAITVPLTLRRLDGFKALGIRGPSQFSYAVETRLRNPSNDVGGGYGIIPAMGEPLAQTFNRDRSGTVYFNSQLWRIRRAAVDLVEP